jgi:amidohydrolase
MLACAFAALLQSSPVFSDDTAREALRSAVDRLAAGVESDVIAWRRDIHQHPELSNREFRTSRLVAKHLERLKLDRVRTEVAYTGVVGVLKGGLPGPVVALRADMDALPVTEELDLPFASKVRTTYNGLEVGVMHACGHDAHTAILMGAAEILASMRQQLPGTIVFIFQPAEEGPPLEEGGGARMMIEQGALTNPAPQAIFGLHVGFAGPVGTIGYRSGALMGDESNFRILIRGRQTHAAKPWAGVDPITVAAQLVLALQTIPSRQLDQTSGASLISIGTIHAGTRRNIIPDEVELTGTFRTLNAALVDDALDRIRRTSEAIARSAGAKVTVDIVKELPITYNDPALTERMTPSLARLVGAEGLRIAPPVLAAEDFAFYQQKIPGLFFYLGISDPVADPLSVEPNHSPRFYIDERALAIGVRAMASLAVDYLTAN